MAQIKCGHCKSTHASVAEVRTCGIVAKADVALKLVHPEVFEALEAPLPGEHSCEDFDGECFVEGCDETGQETWQCQYKAAAAKPVLTGYAPVELASTGWKTWDIPASRYALVMAGGDLNFWEIQIGKKGTKWAGMRFVKRLVGAPGDFAQYKVSKAQAEVVLTALCSDTYQDGEVALTGPQAAAVRFSRTFTRCASCMAPLTDPVSLATGLGPICAKRFAA
jgi:hypothetical protein